MRLSSLHCASHNTDTRKNTYVWALVFALVSATACQSSSDKSKDRDDVAEHSATKYKAIAVGDQAPLYDAATLTGDSAHIGRENEPVTVLNVWATWCVSCREEMHDLQALQDEYKAKGVRVLGVSVDDGDSERVRKFVEKEKLTFPMVHDQDARVQQMYQVSGLPTTFVIGADGRILWKSIGNVHGVLSPLKAVLDKVAK